MRARYEYDAWGNTLSITDQNGNAITSATHIGNLNPFRYRGYYLDTETGLYYLMSRYYDPVTHRFVNCDGYFQSGENVLDSNMSAYCRNNPISFVDPGGKFVIESIVGCLAKMFIATMIATIFAETVTATVTNPSVQQGISDAINSVSSTFSNSLDNSYSNSKDIAAPIEPPGKVQAIYPVDPMEFNPEGLERIIHVKPGKGKNGGIMRWIIPGTTTAIFEWDEDYRIGSHYHAMFPSDNNKHSGDHNPPGSAVAEPWNSIYFNY